APPASASPPQTRLQTPPPSAPAYNLLLQHRWNSGLHHRRQLQRIPIRQPDTAMRIRVSHAARLGRAVDPVVRYRKIDPDQAHRTSTPGLRCWSSLGLAWARSASPSTAVEYPRYASPA